MQEIKILINIDKVETDFISTNIVQWLSILAKFATENLSWAAFASYMIFFLFAAIALVVSISSQGALIHSVSGNKKTGKTSSFKKCLQAGVEKFWPLLGMNVLNSLISVFFIIIVIEPIVYFLSASYVGELLYLLISIVTFFLLLPLAVVLSFVTRYGAAYIVLKNQKLTTAFVNAWILFKINWLVTIENAILLILFSMVYSLLLSGAIAVALVPLLVLSILLSFINPIAFSIIFSVGIIAAIIILILGISLYGAYYNLVWANFFVELTAPGKSHPKIHKIAKKHLPKLAK
ncbi:hypothetical protein HOB10_04960 [Candidatus Parcubacteria bacterium]|nr:hypothetical protein [Candidatus Parcubacteria bacterium]